ncbi:MAG: DUF4395 family protein [Sulfuricurvum sp.]|nr:DUF4395 family protein [Sulfuricurvum sp.]MDP3023713.1 DUF4395 family protein [Sulfuricurvum sp.]MDP3119045.1 DUF4395 family protein [Sulfuricurvum sp.]
MSQACPLLFRQVDANISKMSAVAVSIGVIAYLLTMQKIILIFIIIDFILRLSMHKGLSPIFRASCFVKRVLNLPTRLEDAGAKRLAAIFGLAFSIAMLGFDFFGLILGIWIVAGIFITCVVLDLLFDYCIACKVYSIARKLYPAWFE